MSSQSLTGFLQVATPVVMPGILLLAACVTVTFSFTLPAQAFYEINSAGGDCPQIGDWDSETRTCTLTTDLDEDVRITSDAVKLDGNGHTISPENNPDYAVRIDEVAAVTVPIRSWMVMVCTLSEQTTHGLRTTKSRVQ